VRLLGVFLLSLFVAVGAASARPSADPGLSSNEIVIGGTVPLSGIAASYASVGRGAEAYFKYVNASGGVNGRKITYKFVDDQYNPAQTVQATRELVQQDKVFAIFNTVGTEHNVAIRAYLNAVKVPQVFGGTGASIIARGYRKYPWTMGYLPSFVGEGAIYGRYVVKHRPKARIAVLYENSDYGRDLLKGLERGLGTKRSAVSAGLCQYPRAS
jgi:branched-chain amino acid transport system substrate-binding protein